MRARECHGARRGRRRPGDRRWRGWHVQGGDPARGQRRVPRRRCGSPGTRWRRCRDSGNLSGDRRWCDVRADGRARKRRAYRWRRAFGAGGVVTADARTAPGDRGDIEDPAARMAAGFAVDYLGGARWCGRRAGQTPGIAFQTVPKSGLSAHETRRPPIKLAPGTRIRIASPGGTAPSPGEDPVHAFPARAGPDETTAVKTAAGLRNRRTGA